MYDVTYNEILERMLSRVSDKFDKREGSVIFDTHSPTALELEILYVELNTLIAEAYGDTASREFLIKRCKERGITPYEATYAVLKGEFTPPNIDVTGKRFNIGSINFIVTEKITDGEYQVQCETPGIVGNQQMGTMIPIDYIEGLETAELEEALKVQAVLHGIHVGDVQAVGHHGPRRRAPARSHRDAVPLGVADEVGDNEEVVHKAHLADHVHLIVELF